MDLSPVDEVHVLSFPSEKVGSRPHMNLRWKEPEAKHTTRRMLEVASHPTRRKGDNGHSSPLLGWATRRQTSVRSTQAESSHGGADAPR